MSPDPSRPPLSPGLYIVATPIGNLGDITVRARDTLAACDGVACEDTRVTGKLMKHLGISKPLWRYNDHSDDRDRARLVASMADRAVALVSDAGTPLVSDPGFRLVHDARAAGVPVATLPGACAAIAGLTVSGLPNDRFMFAGFLPVKDKARRDMLSELRDVPATLVFYETAPRLLKSLAAIGAVLPDRLVSVARELTKLHEECRTGPAAELARHYEAHPARGEIVLMIGPPAPIVPDAGEADDLLRTALLIAQDIAGGGAGGEGDRARSQAPVRTRAGAARRMKRQQAEQRGRDAERDAAAWLARQGWRIVAERVKTPLGEIDLIAQRDGMTAFVEVKWRKLARDLDHAIDAHRLRRVAAAAEAVAHDYVPDGGDMRVDVILLAPDRNPRHIVNAWQP